VFEEAFESVRSSLTRLAAQRVDLEESRKATDAATRAHSKIGAFEDGVDRNTAPPLALEEVVSRVNDCMPLDRRSGRFAALNWSSLQPLVFATYLESYPALIPAFRRGVFADFENWLKLSDPDRDKYFAVVDAYEARTNDEHAGLSFRRWCSPQAIKSLVPLLKEVPRPFGDGIGRFGLVERWDLANRVRIELLQHLLEFQGVASTLEALRNLPPSARVRVLPPSRDDDESAVFFAQSAYVDVLGVWLDFAERHAEGAAAIDELLLEALGDPLGPPQSRNANAWETLQSCQPEAYAALIQRLTRSDIEFFFKNARGPDAVQRCKFWLRFIKQVRRTRSFLSNADRVRLEKKAVTADDAAYRSAVKRAGAILSGGAATSSAFVLWFDNVVVVEFSKKGNATYWYSRSKFEKLGIPQFGGELRTEGDLKDLSLGGRTIHNSDWQAAFESHLADYRIRPDRELVGVFKVERGTRTPPAAAPAPSVFRVGARELTHISREELIGGVSCPNCGAARGALCVGVNGVPRSALHAERRSAARLVSEDNAQSNIGEYDELPARTLYVPYWQRQFGIEGCALSTSQVMWLSSCPDCGVDRGARCLADPRPDGLKRYREAPHGARIRLAAQAEGHWRG
jgi:hypothetical protein